MPGYKRGKVQTTLVPCEYRSMFNLSENTKHSTNFMAEVLQDQSKSHKLPKSLWKRIIKHKARSRIVRKTSTQEVKPEKDTKGKTMKEPGTDQLHQRFQEGNHLKVGSRENNTPSQKVVTGNDEIAKSDKVCLGVSTIHISTQSPETSRRNAICEAIEKQCIDHVCDHEVNLSQRRDHLRVEYVLREVCLL